MRTLLAAAVIMAGGCMAGAAPVCEEGPRGGVSATCVGDAPDGQRWEVGCSPAVAPRCLDASEPPVCVFADGSTSDSYCFLYTP